MSERQLRVVGCPGTQSFQLYAKVSFNCSVPNEQFRSECQAVK